MLSSHAWVVYSAGSLSFSSTLPLTSVSPCCGRLVRAVENVRIFFVCTRFSGTLPLPAVCSVLPDGSLMSLFRFAFFFLFPFIVSHPAISTARLAPSRTQSCVTPKVPLVNQLHSNMRFHDSKPPELVSRTQSYSFRALHPRNGKLPSKAPIPNAGNPAPNFRCIYLSSPQGEQSTRFLALLTPPAVPDAMSHQSTGIRRPKRRLSCVRAGCPYLVREVQLPANPTPTPSYSSWLSTCEGLDRDSEHFFPSPAKWSSFLARIRLGLSFARVRLTASVGEGELSSTPTIHKAHAGKDKFESFFNTSADFRTVPETRRPSTFVSSPLQGNFGQSVLSNAGTSPAAFTSPSSGKSFPSSPAALRGRTSPQTSSLHAASSSTLASYPPPPLVPHPSIHFHISSPSVSSSARSANSPSSSLVSSPPLTFHNPSSVPTKLAGSAEAPGAHKWPPWLPYGLPPEGLLPRHIGESTSAASLQHAKKVLLDLLHRGRLTRCPSSAGSDSPASSDAANTEAAAAAGPQRTDEDKESRRTDEDKESRRIDEDKQSRRTDEDKQSRRIDEDKESRRTDEDKESRRTDEDKGTENGVGGRNCGEEHLAAARGEHPHVETEDAASTGGSVCANSAGEVGTAVTPAAAECADPPLGEEQVRIFAVFVEKYVEEVTLSGRVTAQGVINILASTWQLAWKYSNYRFTPYHKALRTPLDFSAWSEMMWRPLVDVSRSKFVLPVPERSVSASSSFSASPSTTGLSAASPSSAVSAASSSSSSSSLPSPYATLSLSASPSSSPLLNTVDAWRLGGETTPGAAAAAAQGSDTSPLQMIKEKVERGENVIFLSNHQTEPDPQVLKLVFEHLGERELGRRIIFVAGHKVREDPMSTPFSLGCNLLCVHSRKHLTRALLTASEQHLRQQRNVAAIAALQQMLEEGGTLLWVAPSGGRDRQDETGRFSKPDRFDPKSVRLFRLLAKKANATRGKITHFCPMAFYTAPICPPPKQVEGRLGEHRTCAFSPVGVGIGNFLPDDEDGTREAFAMKAEAETWRLYDLIKQ